MKSSLPLSVSIIAKNEAANLTRCLKSLQGIANEIVVVHNDCTDSTVEIAKSFGATCFECEWHGHVEQKNIALEKCNNIWILCLDADEALSDRLRTSVIQFLEKTKHQTICDGAKFNRCSFFMGKWIKHGDWYPDTKLRLIKKGKASWGGINPHDKLTLLHNGESCLLEGELEHYSFSGIRDLFQKSLNYSDVFVNQSRANSHSISSLSVAVIRSVWRFIRCYFLRFGFLDGAVGFIIAFSVAHETLLKHVRCRDFQNGKH